MKKYLIFIRNILSFLLSIPSTKHALFMSAEETVIHAVQTGKNIIRFGDGEFLIMKGKNIHYQDAVPELTDAMVDVCNRYIEDPEKCKYILCMPGKWLSGNGWKLAKRYLYLSCWSDSRRYFHRHCDYPILYGDAFLFSRNRENIYRSLWINHCNKVVMVHNDVKYREAFARKYGIPADIVVIPAKNAYAVIDDILDEIMNRVHKDMENTVVLVSAGPCGKILVDRLGDQGVRAYDAGHCFDKPLHG